MKKILLICAVALIINGCATPARVDQMAVTVPATNIDPNLKNSIGVQDITGGKETNAMWTSQVSSDDFRRALEISLERSGLLSKLSSEGKYQLTADLSKLDQPVVGLDMTVTATVRYSLINKKSRKEIYTRVIQVPFTAKFSDALMGVERLRLANEGAINVNIKAFINDIIELRITDKN